MKYLEKNNLEEELNDDITLVDFFATWCGPCKMMDNTLQELDDKYNIVKVDTDKFNDIAFKYRIMSIPTILVFKNKELIKEIVGFQSAIDLENKIKED